MRTTISQVLTSNVVKICCFMQVIECEYAENMNVCNICRGRFKCRLIGSKRRGYYRRSIKCLLPMTGMTALDAAQKCLAYQVYCVIISCLKSSVIGGGLARKHAVTYIQ